jgi:hypothetical protein
MADEQSNRRDVELLKDQVAELFMRFCADRRTDPADPVESARRELRAVADVRRVWQAIEPDLSAAIAFACADGLLSAAEAAREVGLPVSYVQEVVRRFVVFSWRVDVRDGPPGRGWQTWSCGQGMTDREDADLAGYGAERLDDAAEKRTEALRVLVWEGHETTDGDAFHREERPAR